MAEYISKEFMLKNLEADKMNNAEHCEPVTVQIMERFIRYVKEFPAADVQPVKRGHWIETDYGMFYECSECGNVQEFERNFCYECGADMRGDTE